MSKKRIVLLSISAILVVVLLMLILSSYAWFYTEKQHIQRIRARAERRFLGEDSEYTSLEVYPIYNEYDEMRFALIEFEPQGYIYVYISERAFLWRSMYSISRIEESGRGWWPYRMKEGVRENIVDENGNVIGHVFNRELLRDENGQVITYYDSHFKVAGIENERRYFLFTVCTVNAGLNQGFIPAVKRGDQYLDLVNGEMIDYTPGMESTYAVAEIGFINNVGFDL